MYIHVYKNIPVIYYNIVCMLKVDCGTPVYTVYAISPQKPVQSL